jgi:hypothetical protein
MDERFRLVEGSSDKMLRLQPKLPESLQRSYRRKSVGCSRAEEISQFADAGGKPSEKQPPASAESSCGVLLNYYLYGRWWVGRPVGSRCAASNKGMRVRIGRIVKRPGVRGRADK